MRVLAASEGVPFSVEEPLRQPLRSAWRRVQERVSPTTGSLEEAAGQFTLRGVVGSIALQSGVVLDLAPKVDVGDDWINAVLDLLLAPDRIDVAGDRRAGLAPHRNLLDVLATIYDERLRRALRRDGPILVMERHEDELGILKGKLLVTKWAAKAAWRPHRFPVAYQQLTSDNDYTRTLAYVATVLAPAAPTPALRGSLLQSSRMLRPGAPELTYSTPHSALRRLPAQWGAYSPAWDIAASVLTRRALLSSVGARQGVSLVIEAWPLLERLLDRALQAAVRKAGETGRVLVAPRKSGTILLTPLSAGVGPRRAVVPDGRLLESGVHLATFEAKYARFKLAEGPPRDHVFQAVATAAAAESPLAVLVYPDAFEPVSWRVHGFDGRPGKLTAIGLGLFSYRRGDGDAVRGQRLLDLLGEADATSTSVAEVVEL
jgi:hypothetical protein